MTKKEESVENRIVAAETLAYLIATSASLQRIAAISNHLIPSMASFLNFENSHSSLLLQHTAAAAGLDPAVLAVATAASSVPPGLSSNSAYSTNFYLNKYQQQNTVNTSSATNSASNRSLRSNGCHGEQENFGKRMRQAAFRVSLE